MVRQKISRAYHAGVNRSREHIYQRPYILPIFGLLIGVGIVLGVVLTRHGQTLKVSEYHVVYLFDKGQRQVLNTKVKTVGELVDELPLRLARADIVEPARDTRIVEDNYRVNIYRARPVTVVDKDQKTVTLTAQRSARVIAVKSGLRVFPEDKVVFEQGDIRNNTIGEEVVVKRATTIFLNLYGKSLKIRTYAKTVDELLTLKGVKLGKKDAVKPSLSSRVRDKMQVFVVRDGTKIVTRQVMIPAPTEYVKDPSLSFGATVVRQAGSPGKRVITYQITTKKAKVVKKKVIQSVVVDEPVPQIVARGEVVDVGANKEKIMKAAGISGSDYGYVNFIISRESNWNPAARNAGGCLGLGQACPGSKLTAQCSLNDPVCQLRFFTSYANGRYGGWGGAYNFWISNNYW